LATGKAAGSGVVFDPTCVKFQKELLDRVLLRRLDAILDPKTQQLATEGGRSPSLEKLAWAKESLHMPRDFTGVHGRKLVRDIAEFALDHSFTQVMAPTHLLRESDDEWRSIDFESTEILRSELDRSREGRA